MFLKALKSSHGFYTCLTSIASLTWFYNDSHIHSTNLPQQHIYISTSRGGSNSRSLGHNNKGLHKQTDSFLHPQKSQECQLTTIYPALNGDPSQTFYRSTQNVHLCSSPHHLVQVFSVSRPLDDYITTNEHLLTTDIEKYLLCGLSLENLAVQYLCRILPGIDFSQSTRIFPTYKIKEASPYFWEKKSFVINQIPH